MRSRSVYRSAAQQRRDIGVGAGAAGGPEPQRLDGPRSVDRLGEAVRQHSPRGVLAEVASGCPAQVPPRGAPYRRHHDQARHDEHRIVESDRADGQADGENGGQHRRHALARGQAERADIARGPGQQITAARPLDHRQRQRQHAVDEVLSECGEQCLAQPGPGQRAEPDQDGLHDQCRGDAAGQQVDPAGCRPVLHIGHDRAEQSRRHQAGDRRQRVQRHHGAELTPPGGEHLPDVRPDLGARGDRQYLVRRGHYGSPRVTALA